MAILNVNPTRMELSKLKVRLRTSMRGHKLLKDKRDDMMKRFLALAKETLTLRREVEAALKDVYEGFIIAEAELGALEFAAAVLMTHRPPELEEAIRSLENALPLMAELAEKEKKLHRLAAEIERTRRRVNALEHVQIPTFQETIKSILMKLDENERSDIARLMKVKDMLLARR